MTLKSKYFYNLQASVTKFKRLLNAAVDLIIGQWTCLRHAAGPFKLSKRWDLAKRKDRREMDCQFTELKSNSEYSQRGDWNGARRPNFIAQRKQTRSGLIRSLVLMKVGALIGGWQRKPVNQCKSWSCLKYQATVEGGHGMLASGGIQGSRANASALNPYRLNESEQRGDCTPASSTQKVYITYPVSSEALNTNRRGNSRAWPGEGISPGAKTNSHHRRKKLTHPHPIRNHRQRKPALLSHALMKVQFPLPKGNLAS
ncbi:hypothetical protein PO909_009678 [Leuciscus waleckii]